jgi:hypothetical protein
VFFGSQDWWPGRLCDFHCCHVGKVSGDQQCLHQAFFAGVARVPLNCFFDVMISHRRIYALCRMGKESRAEQLLQGAESKAGCTECPPAWLGTENAQLQQHSTAGHDKS